MEICWFMLGLYLLIKIEDMTTKQKELRFCIEYVCPTHPYNDDGSVNVRYFRTLGEEEAENALVFGTREKVEQWIKDFHKGIVDNFLNPPTKSYQELKEYFKEEKGE